MPACVYPSVQVYSSEGFINSLFNVLTQPPQTTFALSDYFQVLLTTRSQVSRKFHTKVQLHGTSQIYQIKWLHTLFGGCFLKAQWWLKGLYSFTKQGNALLKPYHLMEKSSELHVLQQLTTWFFLMLHYFRQKYNQETYPSSLIRQLELGAKLRQKQKNYFCVGIFITI